MQAVFKENTQNIYTVREITKIKAKQKIKETLLQKLAGIILIAIGIAIIFIEPEDATACVLIIPLGLYLMLTREVIL